jgi:hypothetical protein
MDNKELCDCWIYNTNEHYKRRSQNRVYERNDNEHS